ncbi:phosphoenolpyruvate synthase [Flavobacterium sp. Root420]|uniref:phosphoenolpyruvate synthase n=1 Tax=Flavobacterium sp. Root420 TaxID=1736533 RepID=UPI0006F37577|nr:phosphoenolpyruvate synthase [Flavobacterium sp. Root420]KQX00801.1 phosphoenolpyruvate synthase [Flavobacterium sp. Root420]
MEKYILKFCDIGIGDISNVGGKNASLGEMYNNLSPEGIRIPNGFAITTSAYKDFIKYNNLNFALNELMLLLDKKDFSNLTEIGSKARKLLLDAKFPLDLQIEISNAYSFLCENKEFAVAVRSSATAEDLVNASFAGQHDSFLNIKGTMPLIYAVKCCFASLYTDRAIKYRLDKGFDHDKVFLSVGIQQMVRSDLACSGIGFTLEPESGFLDVIHIAGTWGLGETIVQGTVTPDEFLVFKRSIKNNKKAILQKNLGAKNKMLIYNDNPSGINSTVLKITPRKWCDKFVLEDSEIEKLARWALVIEEHYNKPMDFEWAKDGLNGELYIIQARPETVHSLVKPISISTYKLEKKGIALVQGEAIGNRIICGTARILLSSQEASKLQKGEILVTNFTSPDWDPILKKVAGIITNKGGRTSHASIVAREMGTPAIVGTGNATEIIKDGDLVTMSCAEGKTGYVYEGKLKYLQKTFPLSKIQLPQEPKVQLIISEPEKAFELSFYPNDGVGLLRIEFIISHDVKIHPMALIHPEKVLDPEQSLAITKLTQNYNNKPDYLIEKLSQGVATIAAAFYPKEVIVRMSDFKSNEYSGLLGGAYFEPQEENPMLGFRGASRYYHEKYKEGFKLECQAMKIVRDEMGLTNVKLMIPFCRTPEEGKKVIALMEQYGLKQHSNCLEIYVMAELPSNILLAKEFAEIFDGFSIGSNDLTQLTLGIDRDSELISDLFDEENEASKQMIFQMIHTANKIGKKIGLCGQAPSNSLAFTFFLVAAGISSISFNSDALINGIKNINAALNASKIQQILPAKMAIAHFNK